MARITDVQGVVIRSEWQELEALPKYPACPVVADLDLAHYTIEAARNAGIIDEATAQRRIGVINLRRIVLAQAQANYGCRGICEAPKEVLDKNQDQPIVPGILAPDLICDLPLGRIETYAFGNSSELAQNYIQTETIGMGYK